MQDPSHKLQQLLNKSVDGRKVFGTSFCIQYKDFYWSGTSGNLEQDTPYFIASTTKLFITALVLHLKSKDKLQLDDKLSKYLSPQKLDGLHTLNGQDYTKEITIKNLLAHSSGLPDYFQQKTSEGKSLESEIIKGNDQSWTFEKILAYSKSLKPFFPPGKKGKAHYSDTNFQLLGHIIEQITGQKISETINSLIISPLNLVQSYLYEDVHDSRPKNLYYKQKEIHIPGAMASFGPDGGLVSTSKELLIFLKAFFNGHFFPKEYIQEIQVWNPIFFPLQSGIGIQRFKLPWFFDLFGTIPELLGHSGLSGTLAYHSPEKDLYITGTVNQVAYPGTSFKLAIKLIQQLKNYHGQKN